MLKRWRKPVIVPLMILSVFLLPAGCAQKSEEIVLVQGTDQNNRAKEGLKDDMREEPGDAESGSRPDGEGETVHSEETIVVHVCGAVNRPGIYTLPKGSRLWEAVESAGGVSDGGAGDYLNMAAPVSDGAKVVVPFLQDVEKPFGEAQQMPPESGGENRDAESGTGLVNLNTAGLEQLMTLPGIGESKARAILEYRDSVGKFASAKEITNVPGIKESSYEKLKNYVTVD